jgi:two-component system, NtrC family, response regulator PilR
MNSKGHLLVVDDEEIIIDIFQNLLEGKEYKVSYAKNGEEALKIVENDDIDVIILDLKLPDITGDEVFQTVKLLNPTIPVIIVTAYGSMQGAVELMKRGVFDYIAKPFHNEEVIAAIEKGFRQHELLQENVSLRSQVKSLLGIENIIGKSKQIKNIMNLILQIAPSRATVLIEGESGTGKELVAKAIHDNSPRSDKSFIVVNSGNMPPDLLESNLFGHEKGAFTGAVYAKKGLFEVANGGSIFFDEIGTINQDTQIKLLRVIQEKEFMRLGGLAIIKVDVRIIAATNIDLKKAVTEGKFREDLFYRLNVIDIFIPPLRERMEDIPQLVDHFIKKYCNENNKKILYCSPKVIDMLMRYDWPGNIRELENVIERAIVLAKFDEITIDLIPDAITLADFEKAELPEGDSFYKKIRRFKLELLKSALKESNGVQKRAARILGVKPTTLNEMLKRYGIRQRP